MVVNTFEAPFQLPYSDYLPVETAKNKYYHCDYRVNNRCCRKVAGGPAVVTADSLYLSQPWLVIAEEKQVRGAYEDHYAKQRVYAEIRIKSRGSHRQDRRNDPPLRNIKETQQQADAV